MNSMLYIIAGLIIILIIVVLVLMRKKAQEPSTLPQLQDDPKAKNTAATPNDIQTSASMAASTIDNTAIKFDNLTIAQRFMDQQRYDKAIETLQRGLAAKPNDSQLLVKLLNIYAITEEEAEFNKTYTLISTHGDNEAVQQAQNLKGLVDEEFEQEQVVHTPTDADYDNLDFDLSLAQKQRDVTSADTADELASTATNSASKPVSVDNTSTASDDAFDLILDDLEDTSLDIQAPDSLDFGILPTETVAVTDTNIPVSDSPVIDTPILVAESDDDYAADNIDDGFTFDFDELSEDSIVDNISTDKPVKALNEPNLNDDDFALDFDDLTTNISAEMSIKDSDISILNDKDHNITMTAPVAQETLEDDFTLFLNDEESNVIDEPTIDSPSTTDISINTGLKEDSLDITGLDIISLDTEEPDILKQDVLDTKTLNIKTLEANDIDIGPLETNVLGSSVENTIAQLDAITLNDNFNIEEPTAKNSSSEDATFSPASTPVSDSHDFIDIKPKLSELELNEGEDIEFEELDFNFDTGIQTPATAPVGTIDETIKPDIQDTDSYASDSVPITGISQQFSADFDFIKTLDSQQVTLDLAEQYVQLGEYDSAKRLLNEVITQGNNTQQQQAKALLARTA